MINAWPPSSALPRHVDVGGILVRYWVEGDVWYAGAGDDEWMVWKYEPEDDDRDPSWIEALVAYSFRQRYAEERS